MKSFLNNFLLAVLLAGSVSFTGCVTTEDSPKTVTIKSILAVQATVDNAMTGYAELVKANRLTLDQRLKVRTAYRQFEIREAQALALLEFGADLGQAQAPEELAKAAREIVFLIATLFE